MLREEKLRRLYRTHPEVYAEQVLGVRWWAKQVEIAQALLKYRKVFVKASHSVGKTHLAGGLVNWFFDCWQPSITLTTAPTKLQVTDLTWKEVRVQRKGRAGLFPKAPRMETSPDHFAMGLTAFKSDAFQGRHEEFVLLLFEEATGIGGPFWDAAEGMFTGDRCYWLSVMNPTDTASRAYEEEEKGGWHVITISALEHPNIAADLAGAPAPFPKAVRLSFIQERIRRWCSPVAKGDERATDVEFPPGSGVWHRPGPLFEGRVLGRWPSQGATSVWSDALWEACLRRQPLDPNAELVIGCDVARYGDDFTTMVVRRGNCLLHHETHNGWATTQTAGRLMQLCKQFAAKPDPRGGATSAGEDPTQVPAHIDDDGVGGGVTDIGKDAGFNFIAVSGSSRPHVPDDYPNMRSELWFASAERAGEGRIDVTRLDDEARSLIRRQLMAPKWKVDSQGRRVVEIKDETKKRIGRSPDDADGFNLVFATPTGWTASLMESLMNR